MDAMVADYPALLDVEDPEQAVATLASRLTSSHQQQAPAEAVGRLEKGGDSRVGEGDEEGRVSSTSGESGSVGGGGDEAWSVAERKAIWWVARDPLVLLSVQDDKSGIICHPEDPVGGWRG